MMRLEKYIKTGQGANDYDAVSRLLAEVGFSGWISIEDGMNVLDEIRRSGELLEARRRRYFAVT